jgi:hypothetical protein
MDKAYRFSFCLFFLFYVSNFFFILPRDSVSAQDAVNDKELLQHQGTVEFINNNGMPARIDSRSAIQSIGGGLGRAVHRGLDRAGENARYFVIHCVSETKTDKFDADIIGLGANAGVDHIRNLRLIIQGYLESAYLYSPADAALLARYITIYNAVFRGNMDYLSSHYTDLVMSNITADKAGLARRFDEWAGRTLIVIPLGNAEPGSLSAVDTTTLTDPQVIDEMRKEPDKDLNSRKDMVDLKEREADEAAKKVTDQNKNAEKDKPAAVTGGEKADGKKAEDEKKQTNGDDKKQDAVAKTENSADKQDADKRKEEAQKNQELAERKTAEAQQERKDIAKDQQEMLSDGTLKKQTLVLGTALNAANSPLGKIVYIDIASGKVVNTSTISSINLRTIQILDNAVIALASQSNNAYCLVKIELDSLETLEVGADSISADSLVWINNKDVYAITTSGKKAFFLSRFDADLKLQSASAIQAHPFASVLFKDKRLITQRNDGTPLFLNPQDLTEILLAQQ